MPSVPTTNSTFQFRLFPSPTKDGQPWDTSGATVTLYLRRPDGSLLTKAASYVGGVWQYTTLTTDLNVSGIWTRTWLVVVGAISDYSDPLSFLVLAAP